MTPQVSFYITAAPTWRDTFPFCTGLLHKVIKKDLALSIFSANPTLLTQFLAHLNQKDAAAWLPVRVRDQQLIIQKLHQAEPNVFINLGPADQINLEHGSHCLQIVPRLPDEIQKARAQYKAYQKQGLKLNSYTIG